MGDQCVVMVSLGKITSNSQISVAYNNRGVLLTCAADPVVDSCGSTHLFSSEIPRGLKNSLFLGAILISFMGKGKKRM